MSAILLEKTSFGLSETRRVEIVVWQLPEPACGSTHRFKYRLALVDNGVCVLRYDNEAGKGDHKHLGDLEVPYVFTALDRLVDDFWADVAQA